MLQHLSGIIIIRGDIYNLMKKLLFLLFLCFSIPAILLRGPFSSKVKEKDDIKTQESASDQKEEKTPAKENTDIDKKESSVIAETENAKNDADDRQQIYRLLDFDRRLILSVGEQDDSVCSIFCLAYARAILDEDYKADPYDYWDDGAVWRWADYEDIAKDDPLSKVLQSACDRIEEGVPVLFYVSGDYACTVGKTPQLRSSEEHFVLIIGYRKDADYENLKPSDFYAADPSSGYKGSEDTYMPWCTLTDESPLKSSGEYALYAPVDSRKRVGTCDAYADTCRWDTERSAPVYPNYVEKDSSR